MSPMALPPMAGKLAAASSCAVILELERLPLSSALRAQAGVAGATRLALNGGDDYELCFTVAPERVAELGARLANVKCTTTCIGRIAAGSGIMLLEGGVPSDQPITGFDHFRRN